MNKSLKSVSYAFVSGDIDIYIPDREDTCIVAAKLVCGKCGEHWHTGLSECYLCGEINYYLYYCTACGKKYSITNPNIRCSCESRDSKLIKACINDNCPSNSDPEIMALTEREGGVFNSTSSLSSALNYCVNCGNTSSTYKAYRIYVWDLKLPDSPATLEGFLTKHTLKTGDILISKAVSNPIKYACIVFDSSKVYTGLDYKYDSINQIVDLLYPVI